MSRSTREHNTTNLAHHRQSLTNKDRQEDPHHNSNPHRISNRWVATKSVTTVRKERRQDHHKATNKDRRHHHRLSTMRVRSSIKDRIKDTLAETTRVNTADHHHRIWFR